MREQELDYLTMAFRYGLQLPVLVEFLHAQQIRYQQPYKAEGLFLPGTLPYTTKDSDELSRLAQSPEFL